MSEYNQQIPPRPSTWSMANEGYEKVAKLDYYGRPYDAWERKKPLNIRERFKERLESEYLHTKQQRSINIVMADTDLHDESQQLDNDKWNEKIELHESLKLIEP